ncbi:hypothetical protein SKAU_G00194480 [Synaphobranchus kaupii]|uniref:Uncharacterized protein n=1 Tax=Synaphobranchus kaupii TaxID=118154 RepID=A0A9Q1FEC4_SYNKA|nr:hypothetical protein SKAU_G00194480 [Synaphobranchus kaupii]
MSAPLSVLSKLAYSPHAANTGVYLPAKLGDSGGVGREARGLNGQEPNQSSQPLHPRHQPEINFGASGVQYQRRARQAAAAMGRPPVPPDSTMAMTGRPSMLPATAPPLDPAMTQGACPLVVADPMPPTGPAVIRGACPLVMSAPEIRDNPGEGPSGLSWRQEQSRQSPARLQGVEGPQMGGTLRPVRDRKFPAKFKDFEMTSE